jgi:hypothetical protein
MNARAVVSALLIPAYLSACVQWQVQAAPPQQVLAGDPDQVRITTTNHPLGLVLEEPRIEGDSLVGQRSGRSLAVALADVKTIAVLGKEDAGETSKHVVMGLGLVVLAALVAGIAASCSEESLVC